MREVIIACDFKDRSGLDALLTELKEERPYLKIGMEMYYRYGFDNFKSHNCVYKSLCDLETLLDVAVKTGYITASQQSEVLSFRDSL